MSQHETPAYYAVTDRVGSPPSPEECIEGRVFLDDERLLCGAGDAFSEGGYAEKLDEHSASSLRIMFGGTADPQQVSVNEVKNKDGSITVPLSAVAGATMLEWEGSERRGADTTYAVRVDAPNIRPDPLLIQLGKGDRNRGTVRKRHATLAAMLDARGEVEPDSEAQSTSEFGPSAVDTDSTNSTISTSDEEFGTETPSTISAPDEEEDQASASTISTSDEGEDEEVRSTISTSDEDADRETRPPSSALDEGEGEEPASAISTSDEETDQAEPSALSTSDKEGYRAEPAESQDPSIIVVNQSDQSQKVKLVIQVGGETVLSEKESVAGGETAEWTDLPEYRFDVEVYTLEHAPARETFHPDEIGRGIDILLSEQAVEISRAQTESAQSSSTDQPEREANESRSDVPPADGVEESQTTEPEPETEVETEPETEVETEPETEIEAGGGIEPETATDPVQTGGRSEDIVESTPSPSRLPLLGLLLGVGAVLVIPSLDIWGQQAELTVRAFVSGFPSLFGGVGVYLLMFTGIQAPNPQEILIASAVMAVAVPVPLTIDLLYMRRRTPWNPNRVLYPLGAFLLWPVTVLLYLYRRRKAAGAN